MNPGARALSGASGSIGLAAKTERWVCEDIANPSTRYK